MGTALSVRHVRQALGGREILRIDALDVAAGEHVSVLGPNGAGKTTLLRLLAGVDKPSSGTVTLDGVTTVDGGVELRRQVAYATQEPGLLSTSVRRNVELPLRWRKVPRRQRTQVAGSALERLRIMHLAERPARALSGGEQQRVNLARALAIDPSVLLLDEPASGLDAHTRSAFFTDLEHTLADRTTTVIQVSHRPEEALRFADRVIVLLNGEIHQIGTPETLNRQPADPSVAALIGYDNLVAATVQPDGAVLVGGSPTGLTNRKSAGAATVAVFAAGVRLASADKPGVPARVTRVTPGPGYRSLRLEGLEHTVSLLAHLPIAAPAPFQGDTVRVSFDPLFSAVLARSAASPANDVQLPQYRGISSSQGSGRR